MLKGQSHVSRKLDRYVTVDDGGNYVTISRVNIFVKKSNSSQRELGPPVSREEALRKRLGDLMCRKILTRFDSDKISASVRHP